MVCTSWVKKFLLTLNAAALCEAGNHVVSAVGWEADRSVSNQRLLPPSEAVSVVASVVVVVGQAVSVTEEAVSEADVVASVGAEEDMPPTGGTVVVVAVLGATEEVEAVSAVTALHLAGIVAAAAAVDMDQIVEAAVSEVGSTADHMAVEVVSEAEAALEGETTRAEDPGKTH